jgi:hypothetical protein
MAAIERAGELTPAPSRRMLRDAIDRQYTLPGVARSSRPFPAGRLRCLSRAHLG